MHALARSKLFDAGWFLLCLVASSAWCLTAARQVGATFDEPLYLARGLEAWRSGSHAGLMKLGTMPLAIDCQTLPLYLWEKWRGAPLDPVADFDRMLAVARAVTLVFWWLLLVYGWLAARQLAGPWGGRLAVAWLAAEPNVLAHASLATTDVAISACLVALLYHWQLGRDRAWAWRVGWPAFWFAAAVLAKASGMVFGPLCMAAVEIESLLRRRRLTTHHSPPHHSPLTTHLLTDAGQVLALGFVLVFVYCGCDGRPEPSFVAWAHQLPDSPQARLMVWFAEHLTIFSNAGEGLVRQVKHNLHGHHGAFLLGKLYPHAIWFYFPLALSIKLSAALLVWPPLIALWRRAALVNWALVSAAVLLAFSVTCRVQIGIRLVLPLVVLWEIGLAAAVVGAARQSRARWPRRLVAACAAASIAWMALAAGQIWPHGLCYVNELWGGPERGYLCLSDSNYDWGQGVPELAEWRRAHGLDRLDVWYFGTDPAIDRPPLRHLPLHTLPLARPDDVPSFAQTRYVAVGTTLLFGTADCGPGCRQATEFFRGREPVSRTSTFLIYDLAPDNAGGLSTADRAGTAQR